MLFMSLMSCGIHLIWFHWLLTWALLLPQSGEADAITLDGGDVFTAGLMNYNLQPILAEDYGVGMFVTHLSADAIKGTCSSSHVWKNCACDQVQRLATMLSLWQRRALALASNSSEGRNPATLVWGNLQAGTFPLEHCWPWIKFHGEASKKNLWKRVS